MTKMTSEGHILGCLFQKQCSHCRRHAACLEFSFPSRHSGICWVISHYLQCSRRDLWMKSNANHLPRSTSPADIILPHEWLSLQVPPQDQAACTTTVPPSVASSRLFQAILTSCFLSKLSNTYLPVGTFSPAILGSLSFLGAASPRLASLEASWFQEVLLPHAGVRQHLLQGMEMWVGKPTLNLFKQSQFFPIIRNTVKFPIAAVHVIKLVA